MLRDGDRVFYTYPTYTLDGDVLSGSTRGSVSPRAAANRIASCTTTAIDARIGQRGAVRLAKPQKGFAV